MTKKIEILTYAEYQKQKSKILRKDNYDLIGVLTSVLALILIVIGVNNYPIEEFPIEFLPVYVMIGIGLIWCIVTFSITAFKPSVSKVEYINYVEKEKELIKKNNEIESKFNKYNNENLGDRK